MGKPPFSIGRIAPTPKLVDQYFNDSTGEGDQGEVDARGPWNEGGSWEYVDAPAFQALKQLDGESPSIHGASSGLIETDAIEDLLVDQLRDILHAEKQLVKALPKMIKAARSIQLQRLFDRDWQCVECADQRSRLLGRQRAACLADRHREQVQRHEL